MGRCYETASMGFHGAFNDAGTGWQRGVVSAVGAFGSGSNWAKKKKIENKRKMNKEKKKKNKKNKNKYFYMFHSLTGVPQRRKLPWYISPSVIQQPASVLQLTNFSQHESGKRLVC